MAAYAAVSDLPLYVEGWVTDDADAALRLLERASLDIDGILGPWPPLTTGTFAGLKLDPGELAVWERTALARATAVQAAHRYFNGPDQPGGATPPAKSISGPDFTITVSDRAAASTGRYSPELPTILRPIARLRQWGARARP